MTLPVPALGLWPEKHIPYSTRDVDGHEIQITIGPLLDTGFSFLESLD